MSTRISTYSQIYGTTIKQPCLVATTQNESLSGLTTIDGISLSNFDRVLVWKQTSGEENGIYIVTGETWYRATDMSESRDMFTGVEVYVTSGDTYSEKTFTLVTSNPITANTTPLTFELTSNINYVENYGAGRVLISDGTIEGIVAQSGLTYIDEVLNLSGAVQFDLTYTGETQVGKLQWDPDYQTFMFGMGGGNIVQNIGLDQYFEVVNQTGGVLEKGKVIRASGTLGNSGRLLGNYMIADGTIPYYYTLGVAAENIADGEIGFVQNFGSIKPVNTTGSEYTETWQDGDILYVSSTVSGGLTKFEPTEPNLKIQVAIVVDADSNGTMYVRPDLGLRLGDLHNVQTSGETDGDLLVYDASLGYWKYSREFKGGYIFSGDIKIYGTEFIESASGNSITTGTTTIQSFSCTTGSSAHFDYFVKGSTNQIRSGVVIAAWDCSGATFTETSTPDLSGSTSGINFNVDVSSNNVRLNAVVTDGTWIVKVGSRIIF